MNTGKIRLFGPKTFSSGGDPLRVTQEVKSHSLAQIYLAVSNLMKTHSVLGWGWQVQRQKY